MILHSCFQLVIVQSPHRLCSHSCLVVQLSSDPSGTQLHFHQSCAYRNSVFPSVVSTWLLWSLPGSANTTWFYQLLWSPLGSADMWSAPTPVVSTQALPTLWSPPGSTSSCGVHSGSASLQPTLYMVSTSNAPMTGLVPRRQTRHPPPSSGVFSRSLGLNAHQVLRLRLHSPIE